jgi:F-type H+-transporting ATPase subunit c
MKRKVLFLTLVLILGFAALAFAAEATEAERVMGLRFFVYSAVAAAFSIAISSIGCGLAQGISIKSSVEGVARNPEASGKITVTMIIGLALIESLCIYTLLICLILIFANPVSGLIQGFVGLVAH